MTRTPCCSLDECLAAVADPTRRDLLALLSEHEMSVSELVARFTLGQPTISHHLGVLRHAGLVDCRRQGQWILYHALSERVEQCSRELLSCCRGAANQGSDDA